MIEKMEIKRTVSFLKILFSYHKLNVYNMKTNMNICGWKRYYNNLYNLNIPNIQAVSLHDYLPKLFKKYFCSKLQF